MTERILIVGPSWVGDMVMAQSLFMSLKLANRDASIDVLAPDWTRPLLARMPQVNEAIATTFDHGELRLFDRRKLGKMLSGRGYDRAIVLPGSYKSALVPWFAGIATRTGYVGEQRYGVLNDVRKLDKAQLPLTVQRFVALGQDKDADAPSTPPRPRFDIKPDAFEKVARSYGITIDSTPRLAIAPGAEFGESKRWPIRHFVDFTKTRLDQGWKVLLFGSANDASITGSINRALDNQCFDLAGETSLEDAIDLMSGCDAAVSNDSGLMHVAAALDLPVIAIFGSTSPRMTPPLSNMAQCVSLELDCRPCFKRECPLEHTNCLNLLDPVQVGTAFDELLAEHSPEPTETPE